MYVLSQPKSALLKLAWRVLPDIASGLILADVFAFATAQYQCGMLGIRDCLRFASPSTQHFQGGYARHLDQTLDEGLLHPPLYMVLLIALKMVALLMKTKALARKANCVARQRFSLYDSVGGRNAMPAIEKTPHRKADVSTLRFRWCPRCRPCQQKRTKS